MAKRLNPRHQDMVRDKIQAIRIVEELQRHVFGDRDMTSTEIRAAEILLNKTVPNLQTTELTGAGGDALTVTVMQYARPHDTQ
jgi:hypothetical protein